MKNKVTTVLEVIKKHKITKRN